MKTGQLVMKRMENLSNIPPSCCLDLFISSSQTALPICLKDFEANCGGYFRFHYLDYLKSVFRLDKKSDKGSNSVRMRPENSGALKVVKK